MDLESFVAQRRAAWQELDAYVSKGTGELRRVVDLHRQLAGDLALARRQFGGSPLVDELTDLYAASHSLVYRGPAVRSLGVEAAMERLRQALRRGAVPTLRLAAGVLALTLAGAAWAYNDPAAATAVLPVDVHRAVLAGEPAMLVPIASLLALVAGGWIGGVGAQVGVVWMGLALGVAVQQAGEAGTLPGLAGAVPATLLVTAGGLLAAGPTASAGAAWWRGALTAELRGDAAAATAVGVVLAAAGFALAAVGGLTAIAAAAGAGAGSGALLVAAHAAPRAFRST